MQTNKRITTNFVETTIGGMKMRLRDKTLEELEDLEQELSAQFEDPKYYRKIEVYKEMVRRLQQLVRQRQPEYQSTLDYVKKKLVHSLIYYGTYLKTVYQKDDYLAAKCLEEVLIYDNSNPIASYRLGFLSYKVMHYSKAIHFFEDALNNHKYNKQLTYQLNSQQLVNAHLYLTNSALHIAKTTYEKMNQLPKANNEDIPLQEFSPLFSKLVENEQYLASHAFYKVNREGTTTCSKVNCEELIKLQPENTIILYFSDRSILAFFEGKEAELTPDQGNMLKYFLLKSSENRPATREAFSVVETIRLNTYIQSVGRLRNRLIQAGFPPIFQTTRVRDETAYFYNGMYPFYVFYRVDEEIE